jgi:O-succinylhomoserine sulfhydrylase
MVIFRLSKRDKLVQYQNTFHQTPSNPGLEIIDLEWAGKFAAAHSLILVVDGWHALPPATTWGAPYRGNTISTSMAKEESDWRINIRLNELIKEVGSIFHQQVLLFRLYNTWILSKVYGNPHAVRMDRHCDEMKSANYFEGNSELGGQIPISEIPPASCP